MLDKPETNELDRLDRFAAGGDAPATDATEADAPSDAGQRPDLLRHRRFISRRSRLRRPHSQGGRRPTRRLTRTIQCSGPRYACVGLSADLFGVDAEPDARREVMRAAAVRLINYFVPTTELANQIADALEDGLALPAPAPTTGAAGAAMPRSCGISTRASACRRTTAQTKSVATSSCRLERARCVAPFAGA